MTTLLPDFRLADDVLTDTEEEARARQCPHCRPESFRTAARGWHQRKGPLPMLRARFGESDRRWLDHLWRFRRADGRWTYVAEPYGLRDNDAIADLAWLTEQGYDVAISAEHARHYPGHTIATHVTDRSTP